MLTQEQIDANQETFLTLISEIEREDANTQELVEFLLYGSDFFTAPASIKYHCDYDGGLCEHSLNVYKNLLDLVDKYASHEENNPNYTPIYDDEGNELENEEPKTIMVRNYSEDTLKIVALLHDLSKTNYYEKYTKNKKVYTPTGKWTDDKGKYTWESEESWGVKDNEEKGNVGEHEFNSYFILNSYIKLTEEETFAVAYHHGGWATDATRAGKVSAIFGKYKLAFLLHMADMVSNYIDERK